MLLGHSFRRQIFVHILHIGQRIVDDSPHLLDLDALGQRIHRHQLLQRRQRLGRNDFYIRIRNLIAIVAVLDLPIRQRVGAPMKLRSLPGLIEIGEHHRPGAIGNHDIQDRHLTPGVHLPHAHDFPVHHRLLVGPDFFHRRHLRPVLVTLRVEGNQILHGPYPQPQQFLGQDGPHALDVLHRIG